MLADADLNENATSDVLRWHALYFEPARRAGCTTVMLDHSGHGNLDRERGASGKEGNAKVRLLVETVSRFDESCTGKMRVTLRKNNLAAPIPHVQHYRIGGTPDGFVFELVAPLEGDDAFAAMADTPGARWYELRGKVEAAIVEAGPEGLTQRQLIGMVKGREQAKKDAALDLVDDPESPVEVRSGPRGAIVYFATGEGTDANAAAGWRIENTGGGTFGPSTNARREWTLTAPDGTSTTHRTKRDALAAAMSGSEHRPTPSLATQGERGESVSSDSTNGVTPGVGSQSAHFPDDHTP